MSVHKAFEDLLQTNKTTGQTGSFIMNKGPRNKLRGPYIKY